MDGNDNRFHYCAVHSVFRSSGSIHLLVLSCNSYIWTASSPHICHNRNNRDTWKATTNVEFRIERYYRSRNTFWYMFTGVLHNATGTTKKAKVNLREGEKTHAVQKNHALRRSVDFASH